MRRACRPGRKILDASLVAQFRQRTHCGNRSFVSTKIIFPMMTIILVIVLLLWLIGVITAYTLGGLIHLLLLLALIVLLIDILDRRKVL